MAPTVVPDNQNNVTNRDKTKKLHFRETVRVLSRTETTSVANWPKPRQANNFFFKSTWKKWGYTRDKKAWFILENATQSQFTDIINRDYSCPLRMTLAWFFQVADHDAILDFARDSFVFHVWCDSLVYRWIPRHEHTKSNSKKRDKYGHSAIGPGRPARAPTQHRR